MSVDRQFNSLNEKLQQLLKQYHRLQKENEKLKEELVTARNKELETEHRIEEIQQQVNILKITSGDMSEKDKKEFEKKINQYIREIDKCISFLSQ
jgi:chromosome segregation ATPase